MTDLLRVYQPEECSEKDGYPFAWHKCPTCEGHGWIATATGKGHPDGTCKNPLPPGELGGTCCDDLVGCGDCLRAGSVKQMIRVEAGHRCIRCRHPFLVGVSGVMEGPSHQAKGMAADIGLDVETFDQIMFEATSNVLPPEAERRMIETAPRTNWSDCDEKCRHPGPTRHRQGPDTEWIYLDEHFKVDYDGSFEKQAAWRILTVHHLDEVKANLRWWNLAALCQRCHLLIQRKVTMDEPWPWEHTDWFKPHAAAWYALKYLGQELTRAETMDRLDMLLRLGQQEEGTERMAL